MTLTCINRTHVHHRIKCLIFCMKGTLNISCSQAWFSVIAYLTSLVGRCYMNQFLRMAPETQQQTWGTKPGGTRRTKQGYGTLWMGIKYRAGNTNSNDTEAGVEKTIVQRWGLLSTITGAHEMSTHLTGPVFVQMLNVLHCCSRSIHPPKQLLHNQ